MAKELKSGSTVKNKLDGQEYRVEIINPDDDHVNLHHIKDNTISVVSTRDVVLNNYHLL